MSSSASSVSALSHSPSSPSDWEEGPSAEGSNVPFAEEEPLAPPAAAAPAPAPAPVWHPAAAPPVTTTSLRGIAMAMPNVLVAQVALGVPAGGGGGPRSTGLCPYQILAKRDRIYGPHPRAEFVFIPTDIRFFMVIESIDRSKAGCWIDLSYDNSHE
ncbi:hypothetical protein BDW59DRAFT_158389 [Aspergillus cavernicola]|uniref:Uncharacterized protein n=1 Tax=Aspergillus cavernicola TaxID=176166 RepID=A0ABR4IRS8_9EURO